MNDIVLPPRDQFLREEAIRGGMDLLFLANTRHLRHADESLAACGLGRAHHRVMYFVARHPDIQVGQMLAILNITKQSFRRCTSDLITRDLLEQRAGEQDRRQRLLRLTEAGAKLEQDIFNNLHDNMARAYQKSGGDAVTGFWTVLQHLMGDEARDQFRTFQSL